MLTREKASDYLETRASQDSDIPVIAPPTTNIAETPSVPLGRYPLAIRVDSNEIGDDESSSGLSTPIINTYDFDQPQSYQPDDTPISESPKNLEDEDTWTYPKSLITRNSTQNSVPDLPGDLISERAISEYYNFLYGTAAEMYTKVAVSLEEHYFWTYTSRTLRRRPFPLPKEYIALLDQFIKFWTKTKGPWTVSNFCVYLGTVGQDPAIERQ
ncbi:hypothetical protein CPB86DRAFT_176941 [Serendipita vermifera]|nr:hypothetical protein CPB86DRAFT_176941 [Serendipita vermifera]